MPWRSVLRYIGGPITPSRRQRATHQEVVERITREDVRGAGRRHEGGEGTAALAREFKVSKRTILNWVQGKTRG